MNSQHQNEQVIGTLNQQISNLKAMLNVANELDDAGYVLKDVDVEYTYIVLTVGYEDGPAVAEDVEELLPPLFEHCALCEQDDDDVNIEITPA